MQFLGHDIAFWIAAIVAALIKTLTSEATSLCRAVVSFTAALFFAWAFTDAALDWLRLDPAIYKVPGAVVVAYTCDGAMRVALTLIADPERIIRAWRGK